MNVVDLSGYSGQLDPGELGLNSASFAFRNTSTYPICNILIRTWDKGPGFRPEIIAGGCRISKFDPIELPTGEIGVSNETPVPDSGWSRSNDDRDTSETKIVFEPGHCIKPGKGFILNLTFDETLDGEEGIAVTISRVHRGESYAIPDLKVFGTTGERQESESL